MNALARFYSLGAQDADQRVAAALSPLPLDPADRYLQDSTVVKAVERATRWMRDTWRSSEAGRMLAAFSDRMMGEPSDRRHQAIGAFLLTAAAVHMTLVWLQGRRPGWFWMMVPVMTTLFALLLLAGAPAKRSSD